MTDYLVTIKLPKNKEHDPRNKLSGTCPVTGAYCTDTTGEHHTILLRDWPGTLSAQAYYEMQGFHVTRVEQVYEPENPPL